MITVDNENEWNEYVKVGIILIVITIQIKCEHFFLIVNMFSFALQSHEEAKCFLYKVIPNWDDIVDLCAKDKAIGIGAETTLDAEEAMSKEVIDEKENASATIDLEESSSTAK